jgi:Flp pilus assembly pilin Flp
MHNPSERIVMSEKYARAPNRTPITNAQRGATLVEYVLLIAFIASICAIALTRLGTATSNSLERPSIIDALAN